MEFLVSEQMISSSFKGIMKKNLMQAHLDAIAKSFLENEVRISVVDFSKLLGSFIKVMKFLSKEYYPNAQKSGLIAQAFITSDDIIITNMLEHTTEVSSNYGIETSFFTDRNEGLKWAKSFL